MDDRLEVFFSQSLDGFFFMMLDEPVRWDDGVDKDAVLDYVFAHQAEHAARHRGGARRRGGARQLRDGGGLRRQACAGRSR